MSRIAIYVYIDQRTPDYHAHDPRCVTWVGELDWPGAPRPDDTWFHCGEWAGETFWRVAFNGPAEGEPGLSVEVRTTPEVLQHLIDEHGFTP